ncbi:hypothetical protein ABZW30_44850 [Kitasatospora sp. NPDC004669]|uniref:hypothetical protein n=1 Tax=Kitasatospora sp. NPDC004669 TaxID=3154555 RepID=UPI0033BA621A
MPSSRHLREYFPGYLAAVQPITGGLTAPLARTLLATAPTPGQAARLTRTQLKAVLKRARRRRGIEAEVERLHAALRVPKMRQLPLVETAMGRQTLVLLGKFETACTAADDLADALETFADHTAAPGTAAGADVWLTIGTPYEIEQRTVRLPTSVAGTAPAAAPTTNPALQTRAAGTGGGTLRDTAPDQPRRHCGAGPHTLRGPVRTRTPERAADRPRVSAPGHLDMGSEELESPDHSARTNGGPDPDQYLFAQPATPIPPRPGTLRCLFKTRSRTALRSVPPGHVVRLTARLQLVHALLRSIDHQQQGPNSPGHEPGASLVRTYRRPGRLQHADDTRIAHSGPPGPDRLSTTCGPTGRTPRPTATTSTTAVPPRRLDPVA